jgi:peptide/nickel transport system permease protein
MRSSMLDALRQDYIRTAWAKGASENHVVWHHAFRNSLLPIITQFAGVFPSIVSGAVLIESIFTLPGMGQRIFQAISSHDYPLIFAMAMLTALLTMVGNLIADILYALADPRIRFS